MNYELVKNYLASNSKTWLVTGAAGFIGSNIVEELLNLNQRVVGLDNFSTGNMKNLEEVKNTILKKYWDRFMLIKGDICNIENCKRAMSWQPSKGVSYDKAPVEFVLHQAALGSVSRSIKDPIATNQNNVNGFLNMIVSAKEAGVKRFVFAASSSSYGDHPGLPKSEDKIGKPLSPYAVTKLVNELYAEVFSKIFDISFVGLRYFNVFGKRQDPKGIFSSNP